MASAVDKQPAAARLAAVAAAGCLPTAANESQSSCTTCGDTTPDARVLLATFSDTLANALRVRLGRLIHNQPSIAERLEVNSMSGIGRRLHEANFGAASLATEGEVRALIDRASAEVWFQDEARIGQKGMLSRVWARKGQRPRIVRDHRYGYVCLFAAVNAARKQAVGHVADRATTEWWFSTVPAGTRARNSRSPRT